MLNADPSEPLVTGSLSLNPAQAKASEVDESRSDFVSRRPSEYDDQVRTWHEPIELDFSANYLFFLFTPLKACITTGFYYTSVRFRVTAAMLLTMILALAGFSAVLIETLSRFFAADVMGKGQFEHIGSGLALAALPFTSSAMALFCQGAVSLTLDAMNQLPMIDFQAALATLAKFDRNYLRSASFFSWVFFMFLLPPFFLIAPAFVCMILFSAFVIGTIILWTIAINSHLRLPEPTEMERLRPPSKCKCMIVDTLQLVLLELVPIIVGIYGLFVHSHDPDGWSLFGAFLRSYIWGAFLSCAIAISLFMFSKVTLDAGGQPHKYWEHLVRILTEDKIQPGMLIQRYDVLEKKLQESNLPYFEHSPSQRQTTYIASLILWFINFIFYLVSCLTESGTLDLGFCQIYLSPTRKYLALALWFILYFVVAIINNFPGWCCFYCCFNRGATSPGVESSGSCTSQSQGCFPRSGNVCRNSTTSVNILLTGNVMMWVVVVLIVWCSWQRWTNRFCLCFVGLSFLIASESSNLWLVLVIPHAVGHPYGNARKAFLVVVTLITFCPVIHMPSVMPPVLGAGKSTSRWRGPALNSSMYSTVYNVCKQYYGAREDKLTALDLSLLAHLSYSRDCGQIKRLVLAMFAKRNVTLETCTDYNTFPRLVVFDFGNSDGTRVIAFKGTSTLRDVYLDAMFWSTVKVMDLFDHVFPVSKILPEDQLQWFIWIAHSYGQADAEQRFWNHTIANITALVRPPRQSILTGHSLGGGIAQVVAARLRLNALVWSSPGIAYSAKRFGVYKYNFWRKWRNSETSMSAVPTEDFGVEAAKRLIMNVVPDFDAVALVDKQLAGVQRIECRLPAHAVSKAHAFGEWYKCHSLTKSTCEIWRVCGDRYDRGFKCIDQDHTWLVPDDTE